MAETVNIKLKGINPVHNYKVTLDNAGISYFSSGAELCVHGINVNLKSALSSELILFEVTE